MKTLSKLTATATDGGAAQPNSPADIHVNQGKKGFWRRSRVSARGIYVESSAGGSVFIPHAEIWTLAESIDPKLVIPTTT